MIEPVIVPADASDEELRAALAPWAEKGWTLPPAERSVRGFQPAMVSGERVLLAWVRK